MATRSCSWHQYYDLVIGGCEPCSTLCEQGRGQKKTCEEKCSAYLMRLQNAQADPPLTTSLVRGEDVIPSSEPVQGMSTSSQSPMMAIAVLLLCVLVMGITIAAVVYGVYKHREKKRKEKNRRQADTEEDGGMTGLQNSSCSSSLSSRRGYMARGDGDSRRVRSPRSHDSDGENDSPGVRPTGVIFASQGDIPLELLEERQTLSPRRVEFDENDDVFHPSSGLDENVFRISLEAEGNESDVFDSTTPGSEAVGLPSGFSSEVGNHDVPCPSWQPAGVVQTLSPAGQDVLRLTESGRPLVQRARSRTESVTEEETSRRVEDGDQPTRH